MKIIVNTSVIWGSMDKLLEEGDYTRMNKKLSKYDGIYWMIMTAIYLAASFLTMRWDRTWIIWPVAGVLFAAYRELIKSRISITVTRMCQIYFGLSDSITWCS